MTPEELRNYYAVPRLAGACGEGEVSYQGMRGLGEAVSINIGTAMSPAMIAGVVLGALVGSKVWKASPVVGGVAGAVAGGALASRMYGSPAVQPVVPVDPSTRFDSMRRFAGGVVNA